MCLSHDIPSRWRLLVIVKVYKQKIDTNPLPRSSQLKSSTANRDERQQVKRLVNRVQHTMREHRKDR
jgi:hypothetical protein